MEFLTQGQKLKRLRVQLNLKQKDLADEHITREFISMVEKGRRNFSRQNSLRIMQRILSIAEDKGISLDSDEEYIARDIKGDAEKYCIDRVEKKASLEECQELLALAEEQEIHYAKSKILKRMGDIHLYNQEPIQAFIKYSMALEVLNANNIPGDKIAIFNNMGVCKLKLLQYEEAALYYNNALFFSEVAKDNKAYVRSGINLILIYCNQKKFKEAQKLIDKSISLLKSDDDIIYLKLKVAEAYCYEQLDMFEECMETYYSLEEKFKDNTDVEFANSLGNIYNNMAYILMINKQYEESEVYFNKSYDIRKLYRNELLQHTLILKSELYIKLNKYDEAKRVLEEGIELCKTYNDYEYWFKGLKQLEMVYNALKSQEELRTVYLDYIKISSKNDNEKIAIYGYNKLINLELNKNNIAGAQDYCNQLNKYIEDVNDINDIVI